jgi:phage gp36-like protein
MSYILPSDLESGGLSNAQLIQLTDDAKTGQVDTDKVTKAIEDAEAEVNGYLAKRYTVPIGAPIPNLVQKLSTDIAVWNLYRRRQRAPENVRQAYEDAIKTLSKIADGTIVLDVAVAPPAATLTGGEVFGPERIFTRDTLKGF